MNNTYLIKQLNTIITEKDNPTKVEEIAAEIVKQLEDDKTFFNSLTAGEIEVFKLLKNKFINVDNLLISTSTLADECGVSRTIVTNCLIKMVNANLVTSKGMGSKGTLITLVDPNAFKDL